MGRGPNSFDGLGDKKMNNYPQERPSRSRALIILAFSSMILVACADMTPEKKEYYSGIAGTVLQLAAMNYTGPHQMMAESLITMFNGSEVTEEQAEFDPNDQYGIYANDVYYDDASVSDQDYDSDYQTAGYYPASAPSIDAALVVQTADGSLGLLDNGASLRGPGNGFAGDRVGVAFAPVNDAYVYVVSFDGTGWIQALFPDAALGHRNPVPAGTEILLPGESLYGLDNVTGVETIYILASNSPRPDIQAQLEPFFGKERPPAATYRSVERPIIISRGLTGLRPASVNAAAMSPSDSSADAGGAMALNSFLAAEGTEEVVVTLWFNHE